MSFLPLMAGLAAANCAAMLLTLLDVTFVPPSWASGMDVTDGW